MTTFETTLFWTLGVMVPVWLACISRFSRLLRDRHPEKYEQMRLDELWPKGAAGWLRGHDNHRPVFALIRFLCRGEHHALEDADVSKLSVFMGWFMFVYLAVFLALIYSSLSGVSPGQNRPGAMSPAQQHRNQAYELHRAQKWTEAVAAYDRSLADSAQDPEVTYWRGMAQWQLGREDEALRDFRRVIELEPSNFDAHRYADLLLANQRRWDEILEMWGRYIERTPASAEAYFERGGTNYHKGDLVAAQADAAKACELGKSQACALVERLKRGP